jgi:hypothetical protein
MDVEEPGADRLASGRDRHLATGDADVGPGPTA